MKPGEDLKMDQVPRVALLWLLGPLKPATVTALSDQWGSSR